MSRILVTGGTGFLGSRLCERLRREGHDVLCVGNYYTGRRSNVVHLLCNSRLGVHPPTESYWGHVSPTGVRSCYDGQRHPMILPFDADSVVSNRRRMIFSCIHGSAV